MEKGVRIHTVVTVIPTQLAESHSLDTGGMPVCGSGMWSSPWDWSPIHRRLESPSRLGLADQSNLPLEWQSFLEGIYARYYTTNVTKPFFFFFFMKSFLMAAGAAKSSTSWLIIHWPQWKNSGVGWEQQGLCWGDKETKPQSWKYLFSRILTVWWDYF